MSTNDDGKRMTISLGEKSLGELDRLAAMQGDIAKIDAIRRAVTRDLFIQTELQQGCRITSTDANGKVKELVFL